MKEIEKMKEIEETCRHRPSEEDKTSSG